ncbi:Hypothetical predicted protein [Xyrichtys novacula]|uniref:Uncharacterized protein n=1 Tax=Xyrichtys novacula TaxID=13765 RepID=A0AAV1HNZ0_XYRNO|nr:Hypothetical predicted protein [Xyrichtys novacula]
MQLTLECRQQQTQRGGGGGGASLEMRLRLGGINAGAAEHRNEKRKEVRKGEKVAVSSPSSSSFPPHPPPPPPPDGCHRLKQKHLVAPEASVDLTPFKFTVKVLRLPIQAGYSRLLLLEDKPHKSTVSPLLQSTGREEYAAFSLNYDGFVVNEFAPQSSSSSCMCSEAAESVEEVDDQEKAARLGRSELSILKPGIVTLMGGLEV